MTKILVIEDENMLRDDVSEWLTFEGYEVFSAKDGISGVECAFRDPPDLIVCDIMMPRLDGYGVLLEIRSNPSTAAVPFIFMTAKATTEDIRRGMVLGADDYLTKPFTRLDLLQSIHSRLEVKASYEQNHRRDVERFRKALEQEQDQRLLKAKMVAMFSHDFRNPLATALSSVTMVRDYGNRMDEERRLTHLNRAEASISQLVQMLDDMLFLSQTDANSINLKVEPLYVGQFIERIVGEFNAMHGDTYELLFVSHFDDCIMADPRLLRQIASNLLSNAIKYSPPGGEVHVAVESHEEHCILTVQDHGIGIPETDQPRLFDAFHRSSNVGSVQGTGLGLAIVKQAVDLLGGSIYYESEIGSGTTFTVQIPLASGLETPDCP